MRWDDSLSSISRKKNFPVTSIIDDKWFRLMSAQRLMHGIWFWSKLWSQMLGQPLCLVSSESEYALKNATYPFLLSKLKAVLTCSIKNQKHSEHLSFARPTYLPVRSPWQLLKNFIFGLSTFEIDTSLDRIVIVISLNTFLKICFFLNLLALSS